MPASILKRYFGHDAFRPGQEPMIRALLAGEDALGVMPTGAGKSMCYQIPALLLPGLTLVISPLISLMKDQVAALTQAGIPAACLNSTLTVEEYRELRRQVSRGELKLLYVAPERLEREGFLELLGGTTLSLVAVDEAHCVSQWGQDFRPSYLSIAPFLRSLERRVPVGAFTATATRRVRRDIEELLELRSPRRVVTGFDRPNLYFEVVTPRDRKAYLRELLSQRREASGIVYCSTRKYVEQVCEDLRDHGFSATRYHAGLEEEERRVNQEDFVHDRRRIMVATNAFGMGIDKSNVSFVIHYNMPKDLESYYQEAGRAGRDGERAECILLFSRGDILTARFLIENGKENEALTPAQQATLRSRELDRLDRMVGYSTANTCLRGHILRYFGEQGEENCQNCSNCSRGWRQVDITVAAQKILSCVARVERKLPGGLGQGMYVKILRGSRDRQVLDRGLDTLSTYGIMRETDILTLGSYMDQLVSQGYLERTPGDFPVLRLTPRAGEVLFRGEKVSIRLASLPVGEKRSPKAPAVSEEEVSPVLLERLKEERMRAARMAGVPAYAVFTNATLAAMARQLPRTTEQLLRVPGVGEVKARRYGTRFLNIIATFVEE